LFVHRPAQPDEIGKTRLGLVNVSGVVEIRKREWSSTMISSKLPQEVLQ